MPQMCPGCSQDNPDQASTCTGCGELLRGLLGQNTLLEGRYRLTRVLGCGGMGAVYLAEDGRIAGRQVAVKENLDTSLQAQAQFRTEVSLMVGLNHPGLPRVSDQFIGPTGRQYMVMDYVPGETLEEVVGRRGPLSEVEVVGLAGRLLDILEYLHSHSVIHRDVKPANVKLTPEGKVVLVDFGIAKQHAPGRRTQTAVRGVGSPGFAPLEQYGTGTDARSDLYSLGAVLYYLVIGQAPPVAPDLAAGKPLTPPRKARPDLSPHLQGVIFKAMALYPPQRYQSAAEMGQALAASAVPNSQPSTQRAVQPLLVIGGAIGVLACIALTLWGVLSGMMYGAATSTSATSVLPTASYIPDSGYTATPGGMNIQPTPTNIPRPTPASASIDTPTPAPPRTINLATLTQVSVSDQAKDGVDTCGTVITYPPGNLTDGQVETAWRVEGNGQGAWMQFDFGQEVMLTSVRILSGYNKRDPCDQSIDWCPKNRIPQRIRLQASAGEQIEWVLDNECSWQVTDIGPWRTKSLRVTILNSYPRREEHYVDYTTISEIQLLGWEF